MGKGFNTKDAGAGIPDPKKIASPSPNEVAAHASKDGDSLDEAIREVGAPDYAVASMTPTEVGKPDGSGHKQAPVYDREKAWPAVQSRSPMKNMR